MILARKISFLFIFLFAFTGVRANDKASIETARKVITRVFGQQVSGRILFEVIPAKNDNPVFEYECTNGKLTVKGSSVVALCHGFYSYLKATGQGMVTWNGKRIALSKRWKPAVRKRVESPYRYHYYLNVVTHGYTAAYWDFDRWQQELDWMALHGMDMPLINGAFEAILSRTFLKLGFSQQDVTGYFTGPAHFPWNRMGNITGWDGPFPADYFNRQIALAHQVLNRMNELGMHPVIQCFAGFVPEGVKTVFPDAKVQALHWGGFANKYSANILLPGSNAFRAIGSAFIKEWEKEFGKGKFYLADSFNEMEVPAIANETEAMLQERLSNYGEAVYQSINLANPDAVWVMQGWTFPYLSNSKGERFWTYDRLHALCDKIPDDKLLLLDLANEYNHDFWKVPPSWKTYKGFFNKMWVFSFIPNMGGKTGWNGILDTYTNLAAEALQYEHKGNLVGFGFAPEGIENNELIYELLTDIGYANQPINPDQYLENYCRNRYGIYNENLKKAFDCFHRSCYGTFTDHPRFGFQRSADATGKATVNADSIFRSGVRYFASAAKELKNNPLYRSDLIELTVQYTGFYTELYLKKATSDAKNVDFELIDSAIQILKQTDRLLLSHPTQKLSLWVHYARKWGESDKDKNYYEANAKRLITTWGGAINDYAARMVSGLVGSYYAERTKAFYQAKKEGKQLNVEAWQERWIQTPYVSKEQPFTDVVTAACNLIKQYK